MKEEVKKCIEKIRPFLQNDGGDIELIDVLEDGTVKVSLQGACANCAGAMMTLKNGVEAILKQEVPGVKEVLRV